MKSLYRLDASIREVGSVTRAVASTLTAEAEAGIKGLTIQRREVGLTPLSSAAWSAAVTADWSPAEQRSGEQLAAMELATELADELVASDAFIFAIPLYNFGVSQQAKTWIDLLLTEKRFNPKAERAIAGRPAYLVTARGGAYGPGTPREGWDHSTPWLRRILEDVWGLDLQVIEVELTLAHVNPAMAQFRTLAEQNLERAHAAAKEAGRELARRSAS